MHKFDITFLPQMKNPFRYALSSCYIRWLWEVFCQATSKTRKWRSPSLIMHQLLLFLPQPLQCLLHHPKPMVKGRVSCVDIYCRIPEPLTRTLLLPRPFAGITGLTCTLCRTRWSPELILTYPCQIVKLIIINQPAIVNPPVLLTTFMTELI